MMLISILGSKRNELYNALTRILASSGYRVASAIQLRKISIPKELMELAWAGASVTVAYSVGRIAYTSTYVPDNVDELVKGIRCLMPVKPDVIILLGFRKMAADDERVFKALAVWSAKEAKSLMEQLTPPIIGVYSSRGDYEGEGGYSDPKELAEAIIEEGRMKRYLPPSPRKV